MTVFLLLPYQVLFFAGHAAARAGTPTRGAAATQLVS
jgi:hypothetical protein